MRKYNEYVPYNRNKLPRNKYGLVNNNFSTGSSLFSSISSSTDVGGDMVDYDDFKGATFEEEGVRGLVPAPGAGQQDYFLKGSGIWKEIPAFKWMSEFPTSSGLVKTGLQVNGDLNVTNSLTTKELEVQGAAHFWSLIVDQVKSSGGQVIISPSNFVIDFVGDVQYYTIFTDKWGDIDNKLKSLVMTREDIYNTLQACSVDRVKTRRVYQKCDDGNKRIFNRCEVGDMLRCRSFNVGTLESKDTSNKDYWTFVVNTGEEYFNDNGTDYYCYFVDLAFAFLKTDGHNIPLFSILHTNGTVEYPSGWAELNNFQGNELKKVSQQTLDGTTTIIEEYFDPYEFSDIQNNVLKIRGLDDSIDGVVGVDSSNSLTDNTNNLNQAASSLDYLMNGRQMSSAAPTDISANDLAMLTINGRYSTNNDTISSNDYNTANSLSQMTLSDYHDIPADYYLKNEKVLENTIVLPQDVETEVSMKAAEDLYDGDTIIYTKGQIVPSGTITKGDWKLIDLEKKDEFFKRDDPTSSEESKITDKDELNELNNGTTTTSMDSDRNTDREITRKYGDKTSWMFGYGTFKAEAGDELACIGHLYIGDRQNVIVLSSQDPIDPDLRAPAIAQYNFIDMFDKNISTYRLTAISARGNEFYGSFLVNYDNKYVDINERINLFITDIKSGLETVGIHLDGDNSTITLVGSVDIKQHSSTSYDTLNVYDKYDTKRVEIQPFDIPKIESPESHIDNTKITLPSLYKEATAPKSYVSKSQYREWDGPFWYYWVYNYYIKDYMIQMSTSYTLGNFKQYNVIDLSNFSMKIYTDAYLNGTSYTTDRGDGIDSQAVTSLTYTLKKNGKVVPGHNLVDIKNMMTITGLDSGEFNIRSNATFLEDFVTGEGTYSITFNVGIKVYAHKRCYTDYSNPYFSFNCWLYTNMNMSIKKGSLNDSDMSGRKMTIGTNGLVFNGSNSRYFYAADDGYYMRWDDASISLDSSSGLKLNKLVEKVNYGGYINKKYDISICSYVSGGYTRYLPKSSDYGNGRILTVIGFQGLKLKIYHGSGDKIRLPLATTNYDIDEFLFTSAMQVYSIQLLSVDGTWYIVSFIGN